MTWRTQAPATLGAEDRRNLPKNNNRMIHIARKKKKKDFKHEAQDIWYLIVTHVAKYDPALERVVGIIKIGRGALTRSAKIKGSPEARTVAQNDVMRRPIAIAVLEHLDIVTNDAVLEMAGIAVGRHDVRKRGKPQGFSGLHEVGFKLDILLGVTIFRKEIIYFGRRLVGTSGCTR